MSRQWQLGSRYVLQRRVGSGVMGQVWQGQDVAGNVLAFKVLRPEMAEDPTVVARFLQERNLLTVLRSERIIRVHDLVIEGPRLAIVMDYVAGPSLRGLLTRRGNLPPAEVAWLGARIAEGLAAVHDAGILHRDLKPENVLLEEEPDGYSPKLADFGIAALAATPTGHVGTAGVIGTPQYLAPELGDGQAAGRSSDLYALGIMLYEMTCGTVPFVAETPVAVLRMHADHASARPDGMPDDLWNLITALLAKNPTERPHDAAAVAARLDQLAGEYVGLPSAPRLSSPPPASLLAASAGPNPTPTAASAQQRARRIRTVLLVAGVILLVVLGILLGWAFARG